MGNCSAGELHKVQQAQNGRGKKACRQERKKKKKGSGAVLGEEYRHVGSLVGIF